MKSRNHSFFSICTLFVILWGLYGFHWYDCAKGTLVDNLSTNGHPNTSRQIKKSQNFDLMTQLAL